MLRLIKKNPEPARVKVLQSVASIVKIERTPTSFASITLEDGTVDSGTCLHCPDAPCIRLSKSDLEADVGIVTTYNPSDATCVFDAIHWQSDSAVPVINADSCVGCGVCIGRCPVGALRLNEEGMVELNSTPNVLFQLQSDYPLPQFYAERDQWEATNVTKCDIVSTQSLLTCLPKIVHAIRAMRDSRRPFGLLVRNLFLTLKIPAKASNPGDTNMSRDLVFRHLEATALAELELGTDGLLDPIRRALADFAVTHSRYGVSKESILVFIVCAEFPNRRSDSYELLKDVYSTLHLEIRVLPLALLVLLAAFHYPTASINFTEGFLVERGKEEVLSDVQRLLQDCGPLHPSLYFQAMR